MPSFLSKVFGRNTRKQGDRESSGHESDPSLLEGKFEAVSPNISPTGDKFPEANADKDKRKKEKDKSKENPFSLLRSKSPSSSDVSASKQNTQPQLTLNLPGLKDDSSARALGVVFEADPSQLILSDAVIGSRRLSSLETLVLVRACSQAIMARGLDTLGVMHPHWHSASPEEQRKLISLFIHSLAPKSPITTLSPTLSAPTSAFEAEVNSSRSPHDVAAVLRWGLRHMQLDGTSFGTDNDWYKTFFEAEKSAQYPPTAFSDQLAPKIPATHLELLTSTLDVFSSLAAHAEVNSISGSKLSKLLGLWLLTADRVQPSDDWFSFYSRWDRMGRMLEHLFLSHIRNEASNHRMPRRLTELVQHYPYVKGSSPSPEHDLLPRPRFSTQRYDALFVRVDTELPSTYPEDKPASVDLLKLIANALKAESTGSGSAYELWQKIRQAGTEDESSEQASSPTVPDSLSRILADETIRLLTLRATKDNVKEFKLDLGALPPSKANGHTKGMSMDNGISKAPSNGTAHATSSSEGATSGSPPISPSTSNSLGLDWQQFSTSGFLESTMGTPLAATLMDKDLEVTAPKQTRNMSIGRKSRQTSPRRTGKSTELPPLAIPADGDKAKVTTNEVKFPTKVVQASLVLLDEAFIDFWSDALLDPISSDWPRFVVCRFKNSLPGLDMDAEGGGKKLEWMVIEQVYSKNVPQPVSGAASDSTHESSAGSTPRGRTQSPRPSFSSSAKNRLSFWSSKSKVEKDTKKRGEKEKGVRIGEMGEILKEEDEEGKETKEMKETTKKEKKRTSWIPKKSTDTPAAVQEEPEGKEKQVKKDEDTVSPGVTAAVATGAVAAATGATIVAATQDDESKEKSVEKAEEEKAVDSTAAPPVSEETPAPAAAQEEEQSAPAETLESTPAPAPVVEVPESETPTAEPPVLSAAAPETESTPAPVDSEPVKEATPEPVVEPAAAVPEPEPISAPAEPEPVKEATPEPVIEPAAATPEPEPVSAAAELEPVKESTPEPVVEPAAAVPEPEPVSAPAEPVIEPATAAPEPEPVVEPVAAAPEPEPTPEPVIEPAVVVPEPEPVSAPPVSEPEKEVTPEPVIEPAAAPESESVSAHAVPEPVKEVTPEPVIEPTAVPAIPTFAESGEKEVAGVEEAQANGALDEITAEEQPAPVEPVEETPQPEIASDPEEAKPSEPEVVDTPIVVNDAVIPPDPVEQPSEAADAETEPTPEPVASFAETTVVAPPMIEKEETVDVPNAHVEPLRDPSPASAEAEVSLPPVPVVDADVSIPEPSSTVSHADLVEETPSPPEDAPAPVDEEAGSELPPAVENVIRSGDTPGPQLALSSSEPVAEEVPTEKDSEPEVPPGLGTETSEEVDTEEQTSETKDVLPEHAKTDPSSAS